MGKRESEQCVFVVMPPLTRAARHACRYNLTQFAIQLNEVTPGLEAKLAPTDCRLRPDQHALELGQYDQVSDPAGWLPPPAWLPYAGSQSSSSRKGGASRLL